MYVCPSPHLEMLKTELNAFPDGDHDDLVSACALAHYKLSRARFGSVIWGEDLDGKKKGSQKSHVYVPSNDKPRISGVVW